MEVGLWEQGPSRHSQTVLDHTLTLGMVKGFAKEKREG